MVVPPLHVSRRKAFRWPHGASMPAPCCVTPTEAGDVRSPSFSGSGNGADGGVHKPMPAAWLWCRR